MEFRIARTARDRYAIDDTLFSIDGDTLFVDTEGARPLADALAPDDEIARDRIVADISALGLIHELGHRVLVHEREPGESGGGPLEAALATVRNELGGDVVDETLAGFEAAFPTTSVRRGELTPKQSVDDLGPTAVLEEIVLAWLALANPAAAPYAGLIGDPILSSPTSQALIGPLLRDPQNEAVDPELIGSRRGPIDRLREPIDAAPASLVAQLRWIRSHWTGWLDAADLLAISRRIDALAVIEQADWWRHRATLGADDAGTSALAPMTDLDAEPEAFSDDDAWMSELVLVAKSTYVWLGQLSRAHGRSITRLDEIPDRELDELRERGITGLWLIGLWQRSEASGRIKRMRGDSEAMASAYSVADYRIADELGGDEAWRDLRDRAEARGIRLAADMVPNHMGIDADWVIEHPDRFIWSPHPPFDSYRFSGEDLSDDERVTIQLEDHYWDASDAAVVFKRTDRAGGDERYLYHGNDGTSFPWNDTAQLDYLRADVREAVIEQILDVARRFRVIRFDAAMVLARRHIQRLWYPLPGREPGVPSRATATMSAATFARLLPAEFWREVVDRVAAEVPDTLLLAEAYWLMEGFFVRTLGMHRVYNSAFMHMLRDEKNAEYQRVIAETVAFDRRILGRYVNFMSNPDERTAVDQFGSEDKYFGVATMLATLPGLPMIGHGQIEGYTERYGMEFRQPRIDEVVDGALVERHHREIFPLLQDRWRFAGAAGFRQLHAEDDDSVVDDVFAYANRADRVPDTGGEARSLVVYLNRYERAGVRVSGVTEALGLTREAGAWLILRDRRSGSEFLRDAADTAVGGLELELDGYGCHVFLAFEEVGEDAGWADLAARIGLAGVPDARRALEHLRAEPFRAAVTDAFATTAATTALLPVAAPLLASDGRLLIEAVGRVRAFGRSAVAGDAADGLIERLEATRSIRPRLVGQAVAAWVLFDSLIDSAERVTDSDDHPAWTDWEMAEQVGTAARRAGESDERAWRLVELAAALEALPPGELGAAAAEPDLPRRWFEVTAVHDAIGLHISDGSGHVVAEAWDELVEALAARDALIDGDSTSAAPELRRRMAAAGYRVGSAR